jgi:hypothetical protein
VGLGTETYFGLIVFLFRLSICMWEGGYNQSNMRHISGSRNRDYIWPECFIFEADFMYVGGGDNQSNMRALKWICEG